MKYEHALPCKKIKTFVPFPQYYSGSAVANLGCCKNIHYREQQNYKRNIIDTESSLQCAYIDLDCA